MNRIWLRLIIALLTFAAGSSLAAVSKLYHTKLKEVQTIRQIESEPILYTPKGLAAELELIDREYRARCLLNYIAAKGKDDLACYREWENERLIAIESEKPLIY